MLRNAIRADNPCYVRSGDKMAYVFLSDSFKKVDKFTFLCKDVPVQESLTRNCNRQPVNVASAQTRRL